MTRNPFSHTARPAPERLEQPEPDRRPLPEAVPGLPGTEWVPDDRVDGVAVEAVSGAEAARRRDAELSEAQVAGVAALATLASRERDAYARARSINDLEAQRNALEADIAWARRSQ